jgi:hypothetical protein
MWARKDALHSALCSVQSLLRGYRKLFWKSIVFITVMLCMSVMIVYTIENETIDWGLWVVYCPPCYIQSARPLVTSNHVISLHPLSLLKDNIIELLL